MTYLSWKRLDKKPLLSGIVNNSYEIAKIHTFLIYRQNEYRFKGCGNENRGHKMKKMARRSVVLYSAWCERRMILL